MKFPLRYSTTLAVRAKAVFIGLLGALLFVGVALADTSHRVQPGETLSGIAARYGVSVEAVMTANSLPSRSVIYAGQVLRIPAPGQNPAPAAQPTQAGSQLPSGEQQYTVQAGDNLTAVAGRFGVSVQALAAANGLSTQSFLFVGQVLRIPGNGQVPATQVPAATATAVPPTPTPKPTNTPVPPTAVPAQGETIKYAVQRGESLSAIAYKFDTTVEAIMAANDIRDPNLLEVGQVLTITKGSKPAPQEPVTPMGKLGPKWIELDISTQMLVAYEGTTPVFSARMSSGKYGFPTVTGTFRVYLKYRSQRMRGGTGVEQYDIPNVPHVMYFYSGYAIHGVWWHTNFGTPQSHGCINLPRDHAQWMYDWAPLGTLVVSHR